VHKSKIVLLVAALVIFGAWFSFDSAPLSPALLEKTTVVPALSPATKSSPSTQSNGTNSLNEPDIPLQTPVTSNQGSKPVRHIDMLSEEMKQSIRDKLFFHGPMDTQQLENGVTIMPANGRFIQMPVAVQMPDGSIKIQEYSVLPKK